MEEKFGHTLYRDTRGGFVTIGCANCQKVKDVPVYDVKRATPEGLRKIEAYFYGYFITEPCERDEESLLPS